MAGSQPPSVLRLGLRDRSGVAQPCVNPRGVLAIAVAAQHLVERSDRRLSAASSPHYRPGRAHRQLAQRPGDGNRRLIILGRLVGSGRLLGNGMWPPRCGEPFAQIKGWLVVTLS